MNNHEGSERRASCGLRFLLVVAILTLPAAVGNAQLNGHNLRGDYGLSAGSQPPPGWWVGFFYPNYDIDKLRDQNGDELPFEGDIDVQAIAPFFWWVGEFKILGGNYSILVAPGWANSSLEAPVLGQVSGTGWGTSDLYIQPIVLGWHKERADYLAGLGVFAPVGRYEAGADDNIGLGMWSYEIFAGTTLYLNQAKTWNLAATAFYEFHSSKDNSKEEVGDILTLEGGLGRTFSEGAINIGIAYFAQWKMSEDDFGFPVQDLLGRDIGKHQIYGIGPEVVLPLASKKKFYGNLTLRYLWDFGVESNGEGTTFLLNLTLPIPSVSLQPEGG